jgi:hypothetical protein
MKKVAVRGEKLRSSSSKINRVVTLLSRSGKLAS